MATAYEPRTDLTDRLFSRNEREVKIGFGSNLFARLGLSDPFAGGDITDRALTQPRFDFLSSRAYLAELRGLSKRRLQLLDRIGGLRRSLSSHDRFQQGVSTTAVRAAALGVETPTLIDWSSQIEEADADVQIDGVEASIPGARASGSGAEGTLRETAATRVLRSEITQASGVLSQLQAMLDARRSGLDRGLQNRVSALQQGTPIQRAEGAQRLARQLRGIASIASRSSGIGRHTETTGERPLAVAQARQSEDPANASKGLRRVLGESPVIMTLEEPPAVAVVPEAAPPVRRSARPSELEQPARASRSSHAGRVARVADEARSQGSVGRAGPPTASAPTHSATPSVGATPRSVRSAARPTERIARAAVAASNAPLTDVRRGLALLETAVPAARRAAPTASSTVPTTVGSATSADSSGPRSAAATDAPLHTGVQRVAARAEAGLADAKGRVTGATRYLAVPEPVVETRQVVEHDDAVTRRFDSAVVSATSVNRPMAIARTAPTMTVPEAVDSSEALVDTDDAVTGVAPRAAGRASAPAKTSAAPARAGSARTVAGGSVPTASSVPGRTVRASSQAAAPRHVAAAPRQQRVLSSLPPVARAMQRANPPAAVASAPAAASTPAATSTTSLASGSASVSPAVTGVPSRVAIARSPVVATQVDRGTTGTPVPRWVASESVSPERGALRTTVAPSATAARSERSAETGIARRSRALPTVRAAARTLSQERWGARGRSLAPSVSRFVDTTEFSAVENAVVGRTPIDSLATRLARGATVASAVPGVVDAPVFATSPAESTEAAVDSSEQAPQALAPIARAAERADVHPRTAGGRSIVAPRVVTPFEAPERVTSFAAAPEPSADAGSPTVRGEPAVAPRGLRALASETAADVASTPAGERTSTVGPRATGAASSLLPPEAVLARPTDSIEAAGAASSLTERAVRRGREVAPAARRSLLPAATPEAQNAEVRRIVKRTEDRLDRSPEGAVAASPFRSPTRGAQIAASLNPVLVRSLLEDAPAPGVAAAVVGVNRSAERGSVPQTRPARGPASAALPAVTSTTPSGSTAVPSIRRRSTADPVGVDAQRSTFAASPVGSVESPVARAERRSQSTRSSLAESPVLSSRSFADEVSTVAARRVTPLAPETIFAEGPMLAHEESTRAPSEFAPAPQGPRAATGMTRGRAVEARPVPTVRALDRSRGRRDVHSVVPHPVGTPRTARATTRMMDRAPGVVAAPEGVLVRAQESVDLAGVIGDTAPTTSTLPVGSRIARTAGATPTASRAVLHDGMTLAEASTTAPVEAGLPASAAGARRFVGRTPDEDRSRLAPRSSRSSSATSQVRSAVEAVVKNASVLRAAERGESPVVGIAGARRAYGTPSESSARYEARVTQDNNGTVLKTVVVDTLTGEEIATRQIRTTGAAPRASAIERVEARDAAVQTVDGRPRASMRGSAPEPIVARGGAAAEEQHAPLGQTFADLTQRGGAPAERAARPQVRRRTWNRRQLAHEIGEFAPAMSEAEYLEAPTASDEAPAWARRAVTGTSVQPTQTRSGLAATVANAADPASAAQQDGLVNENGVARAWEPNSLLGALSRADGPEDLIKVIVERRTEVRTLRETLPGEAVRIVEQLASLSSDEASMIQGGSRAIAAMPRTSLAKPSRNARGARDFTQLSSANDGMGANKVMKLADKLMGLIHLAENSRVGDAHRQLQMSQEAVSAGVSADLRGPGEAADDQTMHMNQLKKEIFQNFEQRLKNLSAQNGEF